jgi:membrane associated rhomboid family serine protease
LPALLKSVKLPFDKHWLQGTLPMIILPTEKRFNWHNPPFVLCFLIVANVFIFFFYQSGDEAKIKEAIRIYEEQDILEKEWPHYISYLKSLNDNKQLTEAESAYKDGYENSLIYSVLQNKSFAEIITKKAREVYGNEDFHDVLFKRQQAFDLLQSSSALRFGLKPNEVGVVNLLSHQFMHGGFMHLLGNLFFLVICGFAVEAAIGHSRFLLFYLLSGALGGLSHAALDFTQTIPLIGASGAISGVMAMYLWVFRLKKIEFFYWFYIFVGYIRLPALLVLPLYIGQELIQFFLDKDAHVAFMAHAGGFVSASIMMAILLLWKPHTLDDDYIEEDHSIDPYQQKLADVYKAIESFQFTLAQKKLSDITAEYEETFALTLLRYQLIKMHADEGVIAQVKKVLSYKKLNSAELHKQEQVWLEQEAVIKALNDDELLNLGMRFSALAGMASSEKIFALLHQKNSRNNMMGVFARKLSVNFQQLMNNDKATYYASMADTFLNGDQP